MSDQTDASESTKASGSSKRLVILLLILGLGLAATAYDRFVARPAVQKAYEKITAKNIEANSDSTTVLTNADIRELIGKQPSATFRDENGDTVEVYKWRAGMPVRTYDLFAVFRENGGRLLFYRHAMGKYETGNEILQIASESPSQIPSENREVDSGQMDADSGNPGDAGQDEPTRPEANEDTEGPVGDALPTKSLPPQPGNGPAETEGGSSAEDDNAPAEEDNAAAKEDNAARSESDATSKESVAPDSEQEKSVE